MARGLTLAYVETDEETGITVLKIIEDEERGRRLKTASSRRAVPLHQELVKFGFVQLADQRRSSDGDRAAHLSASHPGRREVFFVAEMQRNRDLGSVIFL